MQQADWNHHSGIRIAMFTTSGQADDLSKTLATHFTIDRQDSLAALDNYLQNQSLISMPEIVLMEMDEEGNGFKLIEKIQNNLLLKGLIIVVLSQVNKPEWLQKAKQLKVHDYYAAPYQAANIAERLAFLVKFKLMKPNLVELSEHTEKSSKIPTVKRIFDILFSGILLLLLSPLFLIVALLVRLESKGPIIYKSKRVGTGYKIFDFYKFRSMYPDADKRLAELAALNQYANTEGQKTAFVKFKNDPRITKVGAFIRKTSIDELPQLINILKGDMSTVGNRPLPLYEAEMLTSQEWSWRFLAPAGLTGLWQISKRGREEMSERERKKLDNFYAQKHSLWLDMKILLKTIPAMFQKEAV